ncbi:MAG: gliding motility-associated C-terminal domain-containing protein [Chitinophagaceae bacterium]|nr:gliding motility-associated C-terminal domain-containing protein [Chitinophagaceae bacterium]
MNLRIDPIRKDSLVKNICAGQSITVGSHTYSQPGIYRDTLSTATCDSIVVLNLRIDPIRKDSLVKNICAGQSITVGSHTYSQTGIYSDTLSTATCDSIVVLNLSVNPVPFISIIATPQQVTSGGIVQLNTTPASSYLWTSIAALNNNAAQDPQATIISSSWIYLLATSSPGNCTALDSVFVRMIPDTIKPCSGGDTYIRVPNAFTPDGNTVNDVFKIHSNNIRLGRLQVYNRWGEMVFETANIAAGWDGSYKGKITPGNYVYWISYYECDRTVQKILKGSVILIR